MRKKRLIRAALILLCAMMLCFAGACRNPKNDGETETEAPIVAAETGAEQPAQSEPSTEDDARDGRREELDAVLLILSLLQMNRRNL